MQEEKVRESRGKKEMVTQRKIVSPLGAGG